MVSSTVLVMKPIAATAARNVGNAPEPLSTAVTLSASRDLLTPAGRQNNLLVMGLGG